jgi:hypothetical protein
VVTQHVCRQVSVSIFLNDDAIWKSKNTNTVPKDGQNNEDLKEGSHILYSCEMTRRENPFEILKSFTLVVTWQQEDQKREPLWNTIPLKILKK